MCSPKSFLLQNDFKSLSNTESHIHVPAYYMNPNYIPHKSRVKSISQRPTLLPESLHKWYASKEVDMEVERAPARY